LSKNLQILYTQTLLKGQSLAIYFYQINLLLLSPNQTLQYPIVKNITKILIDYSINIYYTILQQIGSILSARKLETNEQMRQETLYKLTQSSLKIFAIYGFHGATMKQIADEAKLSYGLLYHYFPSKERIFSHLIELALQRSSKIIIEALDIEGSSKEKIKKLSETIIENSFTGESLLYHLIIMQEMSQLKDKPEFIENIIKNSEYIISKFIPIIIDAQIKGDALKEDPLVLYNAYFSFIHGLVFSMMSGEKVKIKPEILNRIILI